MISLGESARKPRQIIKSAGPAVFVRAGRLFGCEARMDENHIGLAVVLVQNHGDFCIRARFEVVAFPCMGEDKARGFFDFKIFAAMDIVLAFRRTHTGAPCAAEAQIVLREKHAETRGTDPTHQMLRFCPGFPDEDARRVEGSMHDQRVAIADLAARPR